jgi:hypothetical protein
MNHTTAAGTANNRNQAAILNALREIADARLSVSSWLISGSHV